MLQPVDIPFLQVIAGANLQLDNERSHAAKAVPDSCSAQCMQLFPWPDMSPIEHEGNLVGRLLDRSKLVTEVFQMIFFGKIIVLLFKNHEDFQENVSGDDFLKYHSLKNLYCIFRSYKAFHLYVSGDGI